MSGQKAMSTPPQSLSSALTDAESIIGAAEKRAVEILTQAKHIHEEAKERGFTQGLEEGKAEVAREAVRLVEDTTKLNEKLANAAARLAIEISRSLLGEEIKAKPELVKTLAIKALQESITGESVQLIVHPEDRAVLEAAHGELKRIAGGAKITFESDPTLSRGGCVLKTEFGEVDASIESLLEALKNKLGLK